MHIFIFILWSSHDTPSCPVERDKNLMIFFIYFKLICHYLFAWCHNNCKVLWSRCFHHLLGNTHVCNVQCFTTCTNLSGLVAQTLMNASMWHLKGIGMHIHNASMACSNVYMCRMRYLTCQLGPSWSLTTHTKWGRHGSIPPHYCCNHQHFNGGSHKTHGNIEDDMHKMIARKLNQN